MDATREVLSIPFFPSEAQKKLAQYASKEEKWPAGIEGHSFYQRMGPLGDAIGRVRHARLR